MCGIVGMTAPGRNGFNTPEIDLFKSMLHIDMLRGKDSTGVFSVNTGNEVEIVKMAGPPNLFEACKDTVDLYASALKAGKFLIGHNRKSTSGETNSKNAHPFWAGNVVMVHNGCLDNHTKYFKTEVDSEALCLLLGSCNSNSVEEYHSKFEDVSGAFSVIWYNLQTGNLHVFRNSQRPLHWLQRQSSQILVASESELLEWVRLKERIATDVKISEFEANHIYTLNLWDRDWVKYDKPVKQSYTNTNVHWMGGSQNGNVGKRQEKQSKRTGTDIIVSQGSSGLSEEDTLVFDSLKHVHGVEKDDVVGFTITEVKQSNTPEISRVGGWGWMPGYPAFRAWWYARDLSAADLGFLKSKMLLIATVTHVALDPNTKQDLLVYVKGPKIDNAPHYKDFADHKISHFEVSSLYNTIGCVCCSVLLETTEPAEIKKRILHHGVDSVMVSDPNDACEPDIGDYFYVCETCLNSYIDGDIFARQTEDARNNYEIIHSAVQGKLYFSESSDSEPV